MKRARKTAVLLYALFFLSGAAGLICQVVWTRWLTGIMGSAASATAIVLAVFMGGLGLGNWLAATYGPRSERPIRIYAFLEWGVALLVMLPQLEMQLLQPLFLSVAARYGTETLALDGLRFFAALLALGPPTILMGASLPLVVQALVRQQDAGLGRITAGAYFVNTLGGVGATLVAGFFLIEVFGLQTSAMIAGGLAGLCGLGAFLLDKKIPVSAPAPTVAQAPRTAKTNPDWILAAAAASGFCALGYETIWARVLSLLTLNTTYAFSLMLATVLTGIALGSLAIRRWLRPASDPVLVFVVLQVALALMATGSLRLGPEMAGLARDWVQDGSWLPVWLGRPLLLTLLMVLPASLLMGTALPVAATLYSQYCTGIARPVGRAFGANTLGALAGALVIGLLVVPSQGSWRAATCCAVVGLMSASALGQTFGTTARRQRMAKAVTVLAVLYLLAGFLLPTSLVPRRGLDDEEHLVFQREDAYGLVEVTEHRAFGVLNMRTNRQHSEGSTLSRGVDGQRRQALLPLLLHPSPEAVLEIGLGTGIKAGAPLPDRVKAMTVVELSSAVVEASRLFADYSLRPAPSIQVHCNDGRNFLTLSGNQYDIISTGVLTPYRAGVSRLYTAEHFKECRQHLKKDGMVVVWIAIRQIALMDLKTLVATLQSVLPNTTLWVEGDYLALIAQHRAPSWSRSELLTRESNQQQPIPVDNTLAGFLMGPLGLQRFAADALIHTEDHPLIEFRTPRLGTRLNSEQQRTAILQALIKRRQPIATVVNDISQPPATLTHAVQAHQLYHEGLIAKGLDQHESAYRLFGQALRRNPTAGLAGEAICVYEVMRGQLMVGQGRSGDANRAFEAAIRAYPQSIPAHVGLAALAEANGERRKAAKHWQAALKIDPHNQVFQQQVKRTRKW